jgi:hypothetical protein
MADPRTHVELVERVAPPPWSGLVGGKFIGVVVGLMNDVMSEGAASAASAQWLVPFRPGGVNDRPTGGLDFIGQASGLPRYASETSDAYLARLLSRWTLWRGSPKDMLLSEFVAAGYPGAEIFVPNDFTPRPDPAAEWSRFWIFFPEGTHPVTSDEGFIMGTGVMGVDYIGPGGLDSPAGAAWYNQLVSIVARLKPSQWVPWDYIFELPGGDQIHLMGHMRFEDPNYEYVADGSAFPL